MSETTKPTDVQGEHPVDTPEQAVARQMIDTTARVTHVADAAEDMSLAALGLKKPAEAKPAEPKPADPHMRSSRSRDE
jgi:hypothetical protein